MSRRLRRDSDCGVKPTAIQSRIATLSLWPASACLDNARPIRPSSHRGGQPCQLVNAAETSIRRRSDVSVDQLCNLIQS